MKFTYVLFTLLILSPFNMAFSQEQEDPTFWQSLLGGIGQSMTSSSAANQAAAAKRIESAIEDLDYEFKREYGIDGNKCSSQCKDKCPGHDRFCTKFACCIANSTKTDCVKPPTSTNCACSYTRGTCTKNYKECQTKCRGRAKLVSSKYLSWDALAALAGITATTLSKPGQEDKRSCEEKCQGTTGKQREICLESNTNEYGESCGYNIPAGQCDDSDPIVKEGACTGWDGGCALYKKQCSCNLRAAQTKQAYVWDPDKNDCVLQKESTATGSEFADGSSDQLMAEKDKEVEEGEEETGLSKGSSSGGGGLSGASGAKGGALSKAKDAQERSRAKGTSLSQKDQASFSPQSYTGYVGESGGMQGDTEKDKKPEDIAGSDTKETLFELIHKTYTGYTDAGRFMEFEVKAPDKKTPPKTKRAKKKA